MDLVPRTVQLCAKSIDLTGAVTHSKLRYLESYSLPSYTTQSADLSENPLL